MRWLTFLILVPILFADVTISITPTTVTASYTVIQVSNSTTIGYTYIGTCYPIGITATAVNGPNTEIIDLGKITTEGTNIVAQPEYYTVLTFTPSQLINLAPKIFCTSGTMSKNRLLFVTSVISTTGVITYTYYSTTVITYILYTLTTTTLPGGLTVYTTTTVTSYATTLVTLTNVTTVRGNVTITQTLSTSISVESVPGAARLGKPEMVNLIIPTTIILRDVLMNVEFSMSVTGARNLPVIALAALLPLAVMVKRRR